MIPRLLRDEVEARLYKGKVIVLLGARQVGKTTLLRQLAERQSRSPIWLNGDIAQDRALLRQLTPARARQLFPTGSLVFIDEAQRLEETGLTLKIIHDHCPDIQVVATGSSSFELTDRLREPLTGRKWTLTLLPISQQEMVAHANPVAVLRDRTQFMVYGSYPEVINRPAEAKDYLREVVDDYLYKDVFRLHEIRKPEGLHKLVQALAYQIGNEVSFRELALTTGLDKETVERYILLLESAFVVFRLPSFSRNLRKELKRARKIYFWDCGIRNAVIGDFSSVELRRDVGALWENFLVAERQKLLSYNRSDRRPYFWRTTDQQEIDYLESVQTELEAFEFKWNPRRAARAPVAFRKTYPDAPFSQVDPENYLDFLTTPPGNEAVS